MRVKIQVVVRDRTRPHPLCGGGPAVLPSRFRSGVTGGFPCRPWNGARMMWTYLALAAGVLVFLNVLIVVVLLVRSRVRHPEYDDEL
jgi:hypothetical protein